jgi:hypothetical protein
MANKRQPEDERNHASVWEIPINKLPDKASEIWGQCHGEHEHHSDVTTSASSPRKIKPIRNTDNETAALKRP